MKASSCLRQAVAYKWCARENASLCCCIVARLGLSGECLSPHRTADMRFPLTLPNIRGDGAASGEGQEAKHWGKTSRVTIPFGSIQPLRYMYEYPRTFRYTRGVSCLRAENQKPSQKQAKRQTPKRQTVMSNGKGHDVITCASHDLLIVWANSPQRDTQ